MRQTTDHVLMIRPYKFRRNEETATNNYYQRVLSNLTPENVHDQALSEFDSFVSTLRSHGICVTVINDNNDHDTPDSCFPNNWISFHDNGFVGIYPMYAKNRRLERRLDILDTIFAREGIEFQVKDYTVAEKTNKFLEGTGSMVLDRVNKKAYAALSPRTDAELLRSFCKDFNYEPVMFHAYQTVGEDVKRLPIYHTNVLMSIGDSFAIICLDSIDDCEERKVIKETLKADGKEIIEIKEYQVGRFAGNMLQVHNEMGLQYLVMSSSAHKSLDARQISLIEKHCQIISSSLDTIEACGGGSARCMLAEIFYPKKNVQET